MSVLKGQSLLSNISNLSYHLQAKPILTNSDFFKDSVPVGYAKKGQKQKSDQQIGLETLPMITYSTSKSSNCQKQPVGAFTFCWIHQGKKTVEGVSDDEFQNFDDCHTIQDKEKNNQKQLVMVDRNTTEMKEEKKSYKGKNETKNIPKNFGKAIIIFIEKNKKKYKHLFEQYNVNYKEFMEQILTKKKYINTIKQLREIWTQFKYAKLMRIISCKFLRKHSLEYIFNSRIKSFSSHIKYKKRLQQALIDPSQFCHIKDY